MAGVLLGSELPTPRAARWRLGLSGWEAPEDLFRLTLRGMGEDGTGESRDWGEVGGEGGSVVERAVRGGGAVRGGTDEWEPPALFGQREARAVLRRARAAAATSTGTRRAAAVGWLGEAMRRALLGEETEGASEFFRPEVQSGARSARL